MSVGGAHQTAHWIWLLKEASTKLRVGASEKMAPRFSSPARSFRTMMTKAICSVLSIYSGTNRATRCGGETGPGTRTARDVTENGGNGQTDWRDCARLQQSVDDHWR